MNQRHTEFFGPDFARGPFSSSNIEATAVNIAAAIAQLRAPLARDDDAILAHADFIHSLAQRLVPRIASYVGVEITSSDFGLLTTFRLNFPQRALLRVWLADSYGGPPTASTVDTTLVVTGTVIEEVSSDTDWIIATDANGIAALATSYIGDGTWYWGVARGEHVFYDGPLNFSA